MQTRMESVYERLCDLAIAVGISTWLQAFLVEDILHIGEVSVGQALYTTLIFSAVSFVRGYFIRRLFNYFVVRRLTK